LSLPFVLMNPPGFKSVDDSRRNSLVWRTQSPERGKSPTDFNPGEGWLF
jgi:hypothetical protein